MFWQYHIMIAADYQRGTADSMELLNGDMWLIRERVEQLQLVFHFRGRAFHSADGIARRFIGIHGPFINEWVNRRAIGPEVCTGNRQFFHLIGMPDSKQQSIYTAVAPAYYVTRFQVKLIQQRV